MQVKDLKLQNFKNYTQEAFSFHSRFNCLIGLNGMGKTNVLDALHYLAFTKSAFSGTDNQNILHGEPYFSITATLSFQEENKVHCYFEKGRGKVFQVNKVEIEKLSDHIGSIPLILSTPYDQALILEGSEVRRKFIDGTISQYDREYLENLLKYHRVLRQRNATLKNGNMSRSSMNGLLDVYDKDICRLSKYLSGKRNELIETFSPHFVESYQLISNGHEHASLSHETSVLDDGFEGSFRQNREKDMMTQRTTSGCHKDDFTFLLEEYPLKKEGSQGQQKSYLLALRLAQYFLLANKSGHSPLLLLDDVFDKLDDERIQSILHLLESDERFGQIIITDARKERIKNLFEGYEAVKFFEISNGKIVTNG